MPFICLSDIRISVTDKELAEVAQGYESPKSQRAIATAVEEVKGFLNFKYDVDLIFAVNAYDFSAAQAYKNSEVVIDANGVSYTCIADAPPNTPLTDTNYFAQRDSRSLSLVRLVVSIFIYRIHEGTAANRITETRLRAYDDAIAELGKIRQSKINLELPLRPESSITETTQTHTIKITSNPKRNNRF